MDQVPERIVTLDNFGQWCGTLEMRKENLLNNTALGILLGAVIASAVAIVLDSGVSSEWKKWATYGATAFVSLISAALALAGVLTNLQKQDELEAERRRRKFLSARAYLPLALSTACEAFRSGIRYSHQLQRLVSDSTAEQVRERSLSALTLSDETIRIFRELIENTDDNDFGEYVAVLLREYQIGLSRWRSNSEFSENNNLITTVSDVHQRTVYWAYLYAAVSAMFDYARGETKEFKPECSTERIASAINNADLHGSFPGEPNDLWAENMNDEIGLYYRTFLRRFLKKEPGQSEPGSAH